MAVSCGARRIPRGCFVRKLLEMIGREGRRRLPPRQNSFRAIAILIVTPIVGLIGVSLWMFFLRGAPVPKPAVRKKPVVVAAAVIPAPKPRHRGDIVMILDDVGFDHQPLAAAMRIDPNINFAVLPNSQRAGEFATKLHARGFEVLCHLPMEPEGFPRVSPGSGAVLTSMSDEEIVRTTNANVGEIPFARGVNNHMGSRATADRRVMTTVLAALPKGMYFIDSRTTGASVAAKVARQLNVRTASRNVFLDDVQNRQAIRSQLRELAREAEEHGMAVGIGHMYPTTVEVLTEAAPVLRREGFRFVRASEAVR
jgi:polysaccharide deacetylase 2 family uncharacterized protein YibQ